MSDFFKGFRKKLALTTALVGITAFAGASEVPQDGRNGIEKAVHGTTEIVNTGVHAVTETALYPFRLASYALSEVGRLSAKGINYVGEKTGTEHAAHFVGKVVSTPLDLSSSVVDSVVGLTQGVVERPVALTTAALDAAATTTRDPDEARRRLSREALLHGTGLAYDVLGSGGNIVDSAIKGAGDIVRSAGTDSAGVVATAIGLVDKEAGDKLQRRVDDVDETLLGVQTAGRFLDPLTVAGVGAAVAPLLDDGIRDTVMSEPAVEVATNIVGAAVKDMGHIDVKSAIKTLGVMAKEGEKDRLNTPTQVPTYSPLSGGRSDDTKKFVDKTELMMKNVVAQKKMHGG